MEIYSDQCSAVNAFYAADKQPARCHWQPPSSLHTDHQWLAFSTMRGMAPFQAETWPAKDSLCLLFSLRWCKRGGYTILSWSLGRYDRSQKHSEYEDDQLQLGADRRGAHAPLQADAWLVYSSSHNLLAAQREARSVSCCAITFDENYIFSLRSKSAKYRATP